jgi:hypothetical protein
MKHSVMVMISIIIASICCNAQSNYQPIPREPKPPGRYVIDDQGVFIGAPPSSLDQIIMGSTLIIDGKVDKVLPSIRSRGPNAPTSLETYSIISVNKVLKGKLLEGQQSVAITEPGGNAEGYEVVFTKRPLVQLGNRCILFLILDDRNNTVKNDLGMPLYTLAGSCKAEATENGTVQYPPVVATALKSYDGANIETFIADLTERINTIYKRLTPSSLPANTGPLPPGTPMPPTGPPKL